jgi:hypothetical protein
MTEDPAIQREAERQRLLVQALWAPLDTESLVPWLRESQVGDIGCGMQIYRANASACAERSLAISFPTVLQLIGERAFAALARACWHAHPPTGGDLADFGAALPGFIDAGGPPPGVPYLADCARLDWATAQAERASDHEAAPHTFTLLGQEGTEGLRFICAPGWAVVRSKWPVVQIRQAHEKAGECCPGLTDVAAALRAGQAENALVWRRGWKAQVQVLSDEDARWCEALASGETLGAALALAGENFVFEPWLLQALREFWVLGVQAGQ